jgi:hypothetical protein
MAVTFGARNAMRDVRFHPDAPKQRDMILSGICAAVMARSGGNRKQSIAAILSKTVLQHVTRIWRIAGYPR